MSIDFSASANTYRTSVRVSGRPVLLSTLRELAEAWADDRERAIWAMDELVQGLNRTEGGFDEAVYDLQANLRLSDTDDVDVDAEAAERLIAELQIAVARVQGRVTALPRRSNGRAA
ncbi:hypothetical protein TR51_06400 [Kitasatospora griseola]|uniref:Uncharacterized protein n=1 Tax=Kitasatospora griseola TaxID=2064 RepID=A0A0D0Q7A5_KITGR|nr:hypothetical protein [Kitasatospora griseola]KIQ67018.1 hypothetical protein TR51_06400 [Kitasatospora griseola]